MAESVTNILKQSFEDKNSFTISELENVLRNFYNNNYQNATYRWRIHDLKERGIIENISRGVYAFPGKKKDFMPSIADDIKKINSNVHGQLPYTNLSFTDTRWYNEFMIHQVFKTYIVLEVEKDAVESVYKMIDNNDHLIFINPTKDVYDNYITNHDRNRPLILKSLISEAPLTEVENIKISSLEKLLVDCFADELQFGAQQEETDGIFKQAFQKYSVSVPKLRRYARRRNRLGKIDNLIKNQHGND